MKLKNKNQIKAKKSRAIKAMALTQIFCLMLEVFAISFIFGGIALLSLEKVI